jgi:hypothetical protein
VVKAVDKPGNKFATDCPAWYFLELLKNNAIRPGIKIAGFCDITREQSPLCILPGSDNLNPIELGVGVWFD